MNVNIQDGLKLVKNSNKQPKHILVKKNLFGIECQILELIEDD